MAYLASLSSQECEGMRCVPYGEVISILPSPLFALPFFLPPIRGVSLGRFRKEIIRAT
jgi:hypothetical protein